MPSLHLFFSEFSVHHRDERVFTLERTDRNPISTRLTPDLSSPSSGVANVVKWPDDLALKQEAAVVISALKTRKELSPTSQVGRVQPTCGRAA
jgi:hypothetical protein